MRSWTAGGVLRKQKQNIMQIQWFRAEEKGYLLNSCHTRMIKREREIGKVLALLRRHPVVGLIGARQVGKTTLARLIERRFGGPSVHFNLESPEDLSRLSAPR